MNKKQATLKQLKATEKAYILRSQSKNDDILSAQIGLSKVTFYTRIKFSNWTNSEILMIEYRMNPSFFLTVQSLDIIDVSD